MDTHSAQQIVLDHLKPVYGFALRRCAGTQDAEDLTQEIILRAFHALKDRSDIDDPGKFIWTIAHHALANYYRDRHSTYTGVFLPDMPDPHECAEQSEITAHLRLQIAHLSALQRKIVIAYYYQGMRQQEIAQSMHLPLGTVKWHLFEARKELKRGMDTMQSTQHLSFHPVRFASCGFCGSVGSQGDVSSFFRSALSQNIVYTVWKQARTINEIADLLHVSPVYVESEAEYLEEYGFLKAHNGRYLCNILLEAPDSELDHLRAGLHKKAAALLAPALCSALRSDSAVKRQTDESFALWALIPYVLACTGKENALPFDRVATHRPDGGHNLCVALLDDGTVSPSEPTFGPCWNNIPGLMLWQMDTPFSAARITSAYQTQAQQDLTLLNRYITTPQMLAEEDMALLIARGYLCHAHGQTHPQCIWLSGDESEQLLERGNAVRAQLTQQLDALEAPYVQAVLERTPAHLRDMQRFMLQGMFTTDAHFLTACLQHLLEKKHITPPTPEQKQSLSTVLVRFSA